MLAVAIAAGAAWLALYIGCAAATSDRLLRRGMRRPGLGGGPPELADPALVNLVTTGCQLDGAAFAATILQLGPRGVLALSEPVPGQLWCAPTREGAGDLDLASYEALALADVTRQFAEAGGAPFQALADMCFADVKGAWDPFEEAVRAEGRRRGLTRARLPKAAVALLLSSALAVAGLAAAAVGDHNSTWWVGAGMVGLAVLAALTWLTGVLGRGDRLTRAGAAVAAWAIRIAAQPAPLAGADPGHLALVVATDGAPPVPGTEIAADGATAPDPALTSPLVTAADCEAVLGFAVRFRGTPTPFATAYRGNGVSVSLITTSGRVAEANARVAPRSGRPLPGIGEGAWLVNRGRTAVVRAGGKTVKLTVRGGPPGAVTRLAEIAAERLTERSEIP